MTPHYYRKQTIKAWFLLILALMAIIWASCSPQQTGCRATRGMSGYSWIKNRTTKEVFILDSVGHVITSFKDGTNMMHSKQSF